jgi:protein-S-isoprenylcysteine O-methyltransferase
MGNELPKEGILKMKKIISGAVITGLILLLMSCGQWNKIVNFKIMTIFIMGIVASYYQAEYHPFKTNNAKVDRKTMLQIIWTVYLTQSLAIGEAFYFNEFTFTKLTFWSYLFLSLSLFGLWFRSWAYITLGKFFSMHIETQDQHQLIESGPYKYLRHPSYTGAFLTVASIFRCPRYASLN